MTASQLCPPYSFYRAPLAIFQDVLSAARHDALRDADAQ